MPARSPFQDALAGLARTLGTAADSEELLRELVGRVRQYVGVAAAALSVLEDGELRFVATSHDWLTELERLEESEGGPCLEALQVGPPLLVTGSEDIAARWPKYAEHASAYGVRAIAVLPMRARSFAGALDLFATRPQDWTAADLTGAQIFADLAAVYLAQASALAEERQRCGQLQLALDSRVVIEQAKGVIAATRGVTPQEAFRVLRKYANDHNATVRAVSDAVVRLGLRP